MHKIPAWLKGLDWFTNDEKGRKFWDGVGMLGKMMLSTDLAIGKLRCLWSLQVEICNWSLLYGTETEKRDLS